MAESNYEGNESKETLIKEEKIAPSHPLEVQESEKEENDEKIRNLELNRVEFLRKREGNLNKIP